VPHPHIAAIPPASAAISADQEAPALERRIGELTAATASLLAQGLGEMQHGRLRPNTKLAGSELVAELHTLRQYMAGHWDFDTIARTHGAQVLREFCGSDISTATIEELVEGVIDILARVARALSN
jgi:hypothetical protein